MSEEQMTNSSPWWGDNDDPWRGDNDDPWRGDNDAPWWGDNANSDEGKEKGYTEFCISPYGSKEATEEAWKKRQEQLDKQEQKRRNQGQNPGAIPPRNLGSNRFGRGNRGRWNDPGNN